MLQKPEPFVKPDMIFSVSDASALLKGVVETAFPTIRIRGELSGITRATSGHIYMSIKDAAKEVKANRLKNVEYEYYNSDNKPIAGTSYSYTHAFLEEAGILRDIEVNHSLLNEGMFDFIELIDNYYE